MNAAPSNGQTGTVNGVMKSRAEPQIDCSERLSTGLVIRFEDGRCGFYSTKLLSDLFPEALTLHETASPDE